MESDSKEGPMEFGDCWLPTCTHMSAAEEDSRVCLSDNGGEVPMQSDDCWSPACTHMSDEEDREVARGRQFLEQLS